jgi:hypothetical protein
MAPIIGLQSSDLQTLFPCAKNSGKKHNSRFIRTDVIVLEWGCNQSVIGHGACPGCRLLLSLFLSDPRSNLEKHAKGVGRASMPSQDMSLRITPAAEAILSIPILL